MAAAIEGYCLLSWLLLRLFLVRLRAFHLGTLFVWTDLLAMTALVYAAGGERGLFWPIHFVRVADQIWISRRRAAALAVGGVACYGVLVLWLGETRSLDWGVEGVKLAALAAMNAALAAVAVAPWRVRARTTEARDLILRLEEQSVELDRERIRAEAANRAQSDFLARMSHELRPPPQL